MELQGGSKQQLVNNIIAIREQNGLDPIEHINIVIDNYLCGKPENKGLCEAFSLSRTFGQWMKGTVSFFKDMRYRKYASQATADARAKICLKCPHNTKADKSALETASDWLTTATIEDRKAFRHQDLHSCTICSCPLKCKVWYGDKIENPKPVNDNLPDYCWQKNKGK